MNDILSIINSLKEAGEYTAAREVALAALRRSPSYPPLLQALAEITFTMNRYEEALECLEALRAQGIDNANLSFNRAQCLYFTFRAPEAIPLLRSVIAAHPGEASLLATLALYLASVGENEESYALLKSIPAETPGVRAQLGWHMLREGHFQEAFKNLQFEKGVWHAEKIYDLPQEKLYAAGLPLQGKRIFVVSEGGLGDEILFTRFIQILKSRGAYVIFGCSPELWSILRDSPSAPHEFRKITEVKGQEYDYYAPLMSLPILLECTNPYSGISIPYLSADPAYVEKWKPKVAKVANGKPAIAIRWQGKMELEYRQARAVSVQEMLPLAELGALFSIQRDNGLEELRKNDPVYDLGPDLVSWDETLGVLANMDYVVTSCTSTVHIAGAMGKKTALIAAFSYPLYFPWAVPGEKTDWYPSVKVFRQTRYNDWKGAIQAAYEWIKKDIEETRKEKLTATKNGV
ncbi:tetratricopeptide repeat protein [Candidatus Parcubacteria bacterium]|nr:tetratricopeptide repeat protein [Candidatus Parcubacteria bacterium]